MRYQGAEAENPVLLGGESTQRFSFKEPPPRRTVRWERSVWGNLGADDKMTRELSIVSPSPHSACKCMLLRCHQRVSWSAPQENGAHSSCMRTPSSQMPYSHPTSMCPGC